MLDQKLVRAIRSSGIAQGAAEVEQRANLLKELGFRTAENAEHAFVAGCFLPTLVPNSMVAFRLLLEHYGVDYTLLQKDYCCGNLLLRQATRDKTGDELKHADALAREFLENNLVQVRQVGAKKVLLFCVGCDLVHARFRSSVPEEILWYPTLLARLFKGGELDMEADYYPGCHYYYRRLNRSLPDLHSVTTVLSRIKGLRLNHVDGRLCCTRPQQMESLVAGIKSKVVITPCGGCAMSLEPVLKSTRDCRVVMLPEVVLAAINHQPL